MENRFQKWVTVSYLAVGVLVGYMIFTLAMKITAAYDLETRFRDAELIIRGLSVFMAALVVFLFYRNPKVNTFMNEVMVELSRVAWPTQKETSNATVVVVIMVIISGMVLGALDYLWTVLLKSIV